MRALLLVLATYLITVLQCTVCPSLQIGHASPDLLALQAHALVLMSSSPYRFLWAGWLGLLHDLVSPGRLGIAMLAFALSGYLLGKLYRQMYPRHLIIQSLLLLFGVGLGLGVLACLRVLLGESSAAWSELASAVGGAAAYTTALAIPGLLFFKKRCKPTIA